MFVRADVLVSVATGGYFGMASLGALYQPNSHNELELSAGLYHAGLTDYTQFNFAYRYAHWQLPWEDRLWTPIVAGIFVVYSVDPKNFFSESPDKYPSPGYYDQTQYRWGVEAASKLALSQSRYEIAYWFRIIDIGLVAIYNNAHRDLQYFVSSGFSLRYRFE